MNKEKTNNLILCIIVVLSIFGFSPLFSYLFAFVKNDALRTIIANAIYLLILIIIYRKEIIKGFKDLKSDYKSVINVGLKYWLLGITIMIVSNLIINLLIFPQGTSANETIARNVILESPIMGFFSAVLFGPFIEEIIFRISLRRVIKKDTLYVIVSALIFGAMHLTSITTPLEIIYIIPYAALGFAFAKMNCESKNALTSVIMHTLHNLMSFLLIVFYLG